MDEETLRRSLEPFFTTKPVGKGTGLGLAMVDGFMRQSGGALRLQSEVGSGTTAELWLPVASAHLEHSAEGDGAAAAAASRALSVLVVDDDPMVLAAIRSMLEDLGHTPTTAATGKEALDKLAANANFDVVITDHAMAGMTGVQLANRIRKQHPQLPVLLVTGYAELGAKAKGLRVLPKPFQQNELTAALAALFHDEAGVLPGMEPER
jgi:CheY-like chemotaxis protein